ncbi:MAG: CPBP family glutamic-type intramembrane protease [Chloroflexota bacterium]
MKWLAPALAYLSVALGLFVFRNAWAALLGFHAAILGSLFIAQPAKPISLLFSNSNKKWVVWSVLLCGSSGIALFFLWNVFGVVQNLPAQVEALGLNSKTWIPFVAYFALINPFIEEYFWRGYLGDPSRKFHLSDFLYSGFHALVLFGRVRFGSILFAFMVLAIAGWFWRQIARADGGLLAAVLGHMAADLTILMTVCIMTT